MTDELSWSPFDPPRPEPETPALPVVSNEEIDKHAYADEYMCPSCGWEPEDMFDGDCLGTSVARHVRTCDYEGRDWTELWKCPKCGTVFSLDNGDN